MSQTRTTHRTQHNRIELALHEFPCAAGESGDQALLLLHGLGEQSPLDLPSEYDAWNGPVFALDFTGHGESTVPSGGGYTAEILTADVDAALVAIGDLLDVAEPKVTVAGRGLGAYIALQIAGARPETVHGAILLDGPGLAGGPTGPTSLTVLEAGLRSDTHDPYALAELGRDLRPPDYATTFVRLALAGSALDFPVSVATVFRPPWLEAVAAEHGVVDASLSEALTAYA